MSTEMNRRAMLEAAGRWAGLTAMAGFVSHIAGSALAEPVTADNAQPFSPDTVRKVAERLSKSEFQRPKLDLPEPFNALSYDQYRDIRFKSEQSVWHGEKLDFELQFFPVGFLYDLPVEIAIVEGDKARSLKADSKMFAIGPLISKASDAAPFAFSGFRIHGPLNRADYFDEYAVFQGASYFRGVGRGEVYGMSARGLAINTARASGEEFPFFRAFWIERPKPGAHAIIVHALLDSPSTTGAYRFSVSPGAATTMDIDAVLYPRKTMPVVGIGCLTSMFLYGPASHRVSRDFRPAVYDSEGLAILNGSGERIWRPLTNPRKLQTSAFIDKDPQGFGLTQRGREFHRFEDLEAHYEKRPSVWVEPKGAWGPGAVELIEIPAEEEIHDNVVVYWRPEKPMEPNQSYPFAYRLYWTDAVPATWTGARARRTYAGPAHKQGTQQFVIDFDGAAVKDLRELPVAVVTLSAGTFANLVVQPNPEIDGLRVSFELTPGSAELIELRLVLKNGEAPISESWLYRWTRT